MSRPRAPSRSSSIVSNTIMGGTSRPSSRAPSRTSSRAPSRSASGANTPVVHQTSKPVKPIPISQKTEEKDNGLWVRYNSPTLAKYRLTPLYKLLWVLTMAAVYYGSYLMLFERGAESILKKAGVPPCSLKYRKTFHRNLLMIQGFMILRVVFRFIYKNRPIMFHSAHLLLTPLEQYLISVILYSVHFFYLNFLTLINHGTDYDFLHPMLSTFIILFMTSSEFISFMIYMIPLNKKPVSPPLVGVSLHYWLDIMAQYMLVGMIGWYWFLYFPVVMATHLYYVWGARETWSELLYKYGRETGSDQVKEKEHIDVNTDSDSDISKKKLGSRNKKNN